MARYKYLLGDRQRESRRLAAQARLWDPVSHALFDRVGIRRGWKVLEIGPGQGSLHLELRRRVGGPVDAVERSATFAARLTRLTRNLPGGPSRIFRADLVDAPLPADAYDLIFARWVFLFLPDPLRHLRLLARALRPGGRLVVQDYHRETLMLLPRPEHWSEFLAADRAFFASEGGNASIATLLPTLLPSAGLTLANVETTLKTGHPGSPVWRWLTTFFMGVLDRYGAFPPLTPATTRRIKAEWRAAERHRASLLIAPSLVDLVAVKKRAAGRNRLTARRRQK